ncbi:Rrf2 family transcriptional regulator [Haloferula sargassicola]|uniref:HTH-type transcriptional regulator YwnA n=1 Tax=Haloferula sargassicola TaxID=490096 RepID=A0ABP9UIY7_9BACT
MAANTQFSIAVHLLAGLGCQPDMEATSSRLAASVNTSPSFLRRTLAKLSKAGLIHTTTGKAGSCRLARKPKDITLLDIYKAVEAPPAFAIHHYQPQNACYVSCNIKAALEFALSKPQQALEASLAGISLGQIIRKLKS